MKKGIKFDIEKDQWTLIPWEVMKDVASVMTHGAQKYSPDNWKYVKPIDRYFDACMRHIVAWRNGERLDPETQKNHLVHAICCLLFLTWRDNNGG